MPMETAIPTTTTVTDGNTGGLSTGHIIAIAFGLPGFISLIITISTIVWKIRQWKKKKSDQRSSYVENPTPPPSEVPLIDQPKMSDQTFYDIYLVSTSEQTPQVDKIKDICRRNEWKFTTPFGGKLGVLPMRKVQEAVQTCSHVVLVITKDDCLKEDLKTSMTIEMAFELVENGELKSKVIPIRCCDRPSLPPMLRCLEHSHIDDEDLEKRMIKTIDKEIRMTREGQCQSVSGATGVRDGANVAGGRDRPANSASAAISDTV